VPWEEDLVTAESPVVLVVEGLGVGGAGARGVEWIMGGRLMSDAVYIVIMSDFVPSVYFSLSLSS
jgi:hypothetical protein